MKRAYIYLNREEQKQHPANDTELEFTAEPVRGNDGKFYVEAFGTSTIRWEHTEFVLGSVLKIWEKGTTPRYYEIGVPPVAQDDDLDGEWPITREAFYERHAKYRDERSRGFARLKDTLGSIPATATLFETKKERIEMALDHSRRYALHDESLLGLLRGCVRTHGYRPKSLSDEELVMFWYFGEHYKPLALKLSKKQTRTRTQQTSVDPQQIDRAVESYVNRKLADVDSLVEGKIGDLDARIKEALDKRLPREVRIKIGSKKAKKVEGHTHNQFDKVLKAVSVGEHVMLVGPTASGKTTMAEQIAEVLGLKFYSYGMLSQEYKLLGYTGATGEVVRTQWREAVENGGLILLDEFDSWYPTPTLTMNATLANGFCEFPDGIVRVHEDFVCIAACNTYGRGADRQYVGRNRMDEASLDRFCVIDMDYDLALESALCDNADWTTIIQGLRRATDEMRVRHVISPRATFGGAKLLAAGFTVDEALDSRVWKGLDQATRMKLVSHANNDPAVAAAFTRLNKTEATDAA